MPSAWGGGFLNAWGVSWGDTPKNSAVPTEYYRDPYSRPRKKELKKKVEELKKDVAALEEEGVIVDVASLLNVGFLIKKLDTKKEAKKEAKKEVKEENDLMYRRIDAMIDQYIDYLNKLELRRIDDEEALFLLLN